MSDPDFPDGDDNLKNGGHQPITLVNFSKKLDEEEKFGQGGARVHSAHPLARSANGHKQKNH